MAKKGGGMPPGLAAYIAAKGKSKEKAPALPVMDEKSGKKCKGKVKK